VVPAEFQTVRDAIWACGASGHSAQEVVALLIKISVEIAQVTHGLTEEELVEFVRSLWHLNQTEQMLMVQEALGVSET